jgi:phytol kinase
LFTDLNQLIRPFLPAPYLIALLTPAAVLYTVAAGWLVSYLRVVKQVQPPYTRKIFHFIIFTMAGLIHLAVGLPGVVIFGSIVSLAVLWAIYRGEHSRLYEALARPSDRPRRTLFIVVPLLTTALGGVLGNLLFPRVAYVGYLVCGWGDALGEPVGMRWGTHRYCVPSLAGVAASRSLEGSTAVFAGGCLAAFAGLSFAGVPQWTAVYVALAAGLAGAIVEAISTHGLDNLTVQVVAAGTAAFLLE